MSKFVRPLPREFDRVVAVHWSAQSTASPVTPSKDAIYICDTHPKQGQVTTYHRTRHDAFNAICSILDAAVSSGERVYLGLDFALGYPTGFAKRLVGTASAPDVWAWMDKNIKDNPNNKNNRFDVAGTINKSFPGTGPFWGCPPKTNIKGLPHKETARKKHDMCERRIVESVVPSAQSVWKLYTTGAVGSQVLLGLTYLHKLKTRYGNQIQVWPFENAPSASVTCFETYPNLFNVDYAVPPEEKDPIYAVKAALQVKMICDTIHISASSPQVWNRLFAIPSDTNLEQVKEEGWILGAGMVSQDDPINM